MQQQQLYQANGAGKEKNGFWVRRSGAAAAGPHAVDLSLSLSLFLF